MSHLPTTCHLQEDANDYHQQLESFNIPGNSYFRLVVDRSKEGQGGAEDRDPTKRGHLVFAVTADDQVKQWELLNPQASRESIRNGGQAVGYGPGISTPLEQWNQQQRSHGMETGVTIHKTDGASTTTHTANPKQRMSRDEKTEANKTAVEAAAAKKAKREAADVAAAEVSKSQDRDEVVRCGRCNVEFLGDGWFQKHLQRWCPDRAADMERKRRRRQVPLLLKDLDELRVKEHNARAANLRSVAVTLRPADGFQSEPIGVELEQDNGAFVVSAVTPGSVAHRTAQVQVGFILCDVDGLEPTDVNALSGDVTSTTSKLVNFVRPAPDIPLPGSLPPSPLTPPPQPCPHTTPT